MKGRGFNAQAYFKVGARMLASHFIRSALLLAALTGIASALVPAPAHAQFFYNLFRPRHYAPPPPPSSYAPERRTPLDDFFGFFRGNRANQGEDKNADGTFAHHCVRTCDGKFFPVNRGGRKDLSLDKVCNAMCPSAQTKVFSGNGIDQSVATDGQKYSAITNAFVYRTKIVDNCTCNGRDPFGVAKVDLENDPTLQGGDVVSSETGFTVYRADKFVPIEKSGMSQAVVKQLQGMKILPDNAGHAGRAERDNATAAGIFAGGSGAGHEYERADDPSATGAHN
jgi:hypothetical protein